VVAGEECVLFDEREAEMVGGVAGRGDRLEGEAASGEPRSVFERLVRRVIERMRGVGARRLAAGDDRSARAGDRRAGSLLQQRRAGGVVAMAVGDDDARDAARRSTGPATAGPCVTRNATCER